MVIFLNQYNFSLIWGLYKIFNYMSGTFLELLSTTLFIIS